MNTNNFKEGVAGISRLFLVFFWLGLAGALQVGNINIMQFILSTALVVVIGVSISMIYMLSKTGEED